MPGIPKVVPRCPDLYAGSNFVFKLFFGTLSGNSQGILPQSGPSRHLYQSRNFQEIPPLIEGQATDAEYKGSGNAHKCPGIHIHINISWKFLH